MHTKESVFPSRQRTALQIGIVAVILLVLLAVFYWALQDPASSPSANPQRAGKYARKREQSEPSRQREKGKQAAAEKQRGKDNLLPNKKQGFARESLAREKANRIAYSYLERTDEGYVIHTASSRKDPNR